MRSLSILPLISCCVLVPAALVAQNDVAGSSDHRLFPRIAGYYVTGYRDTDPVVEEFRNGRGLDRDTIEGRVTSIAYALSGGGSQQPTTQLGLVRYYEGIVQRLGGTVLYRQPVFGQLTARLVQNGREFWLRLHVENTHEYVIAIAERSAPAQAAVAALAGNAGAAGPCPCAAQAAPSGAAAALMPMAARRFRAAAARFALDTGWVPVVQPSRGTSNSIVAIRGLHVEDATEVRFGETPARILDRVPSEIAVVVPERWVGLVPVVVSGPAGARTARDSFQIYQEPISDSSRDMRVYTCTEPPRRGAPNVNGFAPTTVRAGDTLVINGTMLDEVDYVSFTYRVPADQLLPPRDRNWDDSGSIFSHIMPPSVERREIAALPVSQTATRLTVVVPRRARTGPVALFGYGSCVLSDQALGVRVGPAPR
ncbi:MAG: IPT/TIG domain-containing protein [Gemmatimonadota bacterium]